MSMDGERVADVTEFAPPIRDWLSRAFAAPTRVQRLGWPVIARGGHTLLVAPTGSGKTLAAFLWGIDRLARLPEEAPPGVRVLYVSPLKALVYDVERNLRMPLRGIGQVADALDWPLGTLSTDIRTGDTPPRERRRQLREPGRILVTTPESLFLLLGSAARETLRQVGTVIVDEIHTLVSTKRGAHLALSLERLEALTERPPQRIGLSATLRPVDVAARFLGGGRPVATVSAEEPPRLDLRVVVPVPRMEAPAVGGPGERGIWPLIYPRLLEEVRRGRSTILFVNSRGLCERLARRLNDLAGETLVLAHHGSLSHARRAEIEEGLKSGQLRGIVATSSLELGIDMGAVDRVLLVESPGSVARGLQRVGRSGHGVGETSIGRIYPKFRGDLLECAVVAERMLAGEIESLAMPRNPLDVLAQQVVALCCERPRSPAELLTLVRRAAPYADLPEDALGRVLDMLSGHYPSTELADLRPWLSWDRERDLLAPRRGALMISRLNAGTIPDRGSFGVFLGADGPRVGELDEEMVYETRPGETLTLGASTWRVEEITRDRVLVSPAPGLPGKLPFWKGDGPGRPLELGRAVGALLRRLEGLSRDQAAEHLRDDTPLDEYAAANLADYLAEQKSLTGGLPSDRSITVERFRDELGDWRLCILTPFGARIHAPWALALQAMLGRRAGYQVQVMYTDDGIALRLADAEELPNAASLVPDPDEVRELVTEQLADSALFAGLFRENAARSLLLPRHGGRQRRPLWAQRIRAQQLLAAVRRFADFPVVVETYRQCLADVFDLPGLVGILGDVRARRIRLLEAETPYASPFARSLVFAYVAAFMYEQDAPLAERRALALTLDRRLLAELIGEEELRGLIDPEVLAELGQELQHLKPDRRAHDADGVEDLLRRLGDLTEAELAARSESDPTPWLEALASQQRAVLLGVAGDPRWIAAADAGLYRDALGAMPPAGLPAAFLAPADQPLQRLLLRFAHTHGPFSADAPAHRFGLREAQVEPVLRLLEGEGRLVRGGMRAGDNEVEWCDPEVLRRLKRRTLARLRRQAAPVEAAALGRFLPRWQGIGEVGGALATALEHLGGLPLPWSDLSGTLLPDRVPGFRPQDLDLLCATGALVWVGRGALGRRDGRVALYPRGRFGLVTAPSAPEFPAETPHRLILDHLERRGACFLLELVQAAPDSSSMELEAALWDLVWDGLVTNDTCAPLRQRLGRARAGRRGAGLGGGRWSLVARSAAPVSETERRLAQVGMLLDRYGLVSREVAAAESLDGGFAALYPVLRELEAAGRVRRGYFVEGLSGAQFALPGALERLREAAGEGDIEAAAPALALCATDPANPYGALLPWPASEDDADAPRRGAGAWVVLVGGRLLLYLAAGGRRLASFPGEAGDSGVRLRSALDALVRAVRPGRGLLRIETIDGVPAERSALRPLLAEAGFVADYRGLVLERRFL